MNRRRALYLVGITACLVVMAGPALALADHEEGPASPFVRFLGRCHPLVVHFPIALIVTAGGLEVWSWFRRGGEVSATALTCLRIGAVSALVAAYFGWINADHETHGRAVEETLFWHRWVGVSAWALASIAAIAGWFQSSSRGKLIYRVALLLGVASVSAAGHLGGDLVYGEEYLFDVFREPEARSETKLGEQGEEGMPLPDGEAPSFYTSVVQPILAENCVRCHGPDKQKGKLRLDTRAEALKGDNATWLVVAGKPEESELFKRVTLPADDFDIMPPEGDPLTAEQIEALRTWILEGADWPE